MESLSKMRLLYLSLFSLGLASFGSTAAYGAACCGGGFALPSIIAGDDKSQLSMMYSFTEISIDNVDSNGTWRKWDKHQQVQTMRLEGAHLISDRWQVGVVAPFVQRSRLGENHSGVGDISASLGYEYLPDWDYNPYRPKGIGYLQITLPTGFSRAESEIGGLDTRGNGFLAIGLGTLLTKTISSWDVFTSFEGHRSFSKKVSNSQIQGTLKPGYGGSFSIGGGYNTKLLRFGGSIAWVYEDPIEIESASPSKGSLERYATGAFSVSYMPSDEWSGALTYSDQTLFGSPVNTSLGRTLVMQLQRRWGR